MKKVLMMMMVMFLSMVVSALAFSTWITTDQKLIDLVQHIHDNF